MQWAWQECGGASFVTNDWALGPTDLLLTSVLYSIYVMCTDVSTAQYVGTVYCVSTAQYDLRTK